MFGVNDVVTYGTAGICRITAVESRNFSGKKQEFFFLKDIDSDRNTYYIPTDNETALGRLRPICSKAEVIALMSGVNLKLPIIVMDGAAMYDIYENDIPYIETWDFKDNTYRKEQQ